MHRYTLAAAALALASFGWNPPPSLKIEVVDARGIPQGGVPVVLAARRQPAFAENPSERWGDAREVVWRGRTAADGTIDLEIRAVRRAIERFLMWRRGHRFGDDDVLVALDVPGATVAAKVVRLCSRSMPLEGPTVRLELPASGHVVVRVDPAAGETSLPPSLTVAARHAGPRGDRVTTVDVVEGVAEFTHVVRGAPFTLVVRDGDGEHRDSRPVSLRSDAATTTVRVATGESFPVLTGRLVDPSGAPIPKMSFVYSVGGRGAPHLETGYVTTDGDGRFRIVKRLPVSRETVRLELWPGAPVWGSIRILPPPSRKAVRELDRGRLTAGDVRIGSLTLAPVPVLVRGVVVHPDGRPAKAARVRVDVLREGSVHPRRFQVDASDDGRFVVHGEPAGVAGDLEIRATCRGRSADTSCAPASEVRIVVRSEK